MKKQFLSLGLTAAVAASLLAGCGSSDNGAASTAASDTASTEAAAAASTEAAASEAAESSTASTEASADASNLKIGAILVGDDAVTYDKAHSDGIKAGAEANGINPDDIVFMTKVPEEAECYDKAVELIESNGCNLVISDSYGHQSYMAQAAEEYPDVNFISMTGDFAAISGLDNFYNAFDNVYESRYVSGVVAGMKIQELVDDGKLTDENYDEDGNVKVGYVGAFNYAEVVSGYTAFYLGITSVYPDAHMYVDYTNSWYDVDAEAASAEKLMSDGCVIIGQHADSTGAPSAVEQAYQNGNDHVFSVGYNVSMLDVAPDVALTSATNNWSVCYTDLLKGAAEGNIPQDWSKGYNEGAVGITELGSCAAEGTADKVAEVEAAIKDGSLKVFDTSTFTVSADNVSATADKSGAAVTTDDAGHVTSCKVDLSYYDYTSGSPELIYQGDTVDAIEDGAFVESTYRSAPYFTIRIDGITELS